jgi:hypothetical protein
LLTPNTYEKKWFEKILICCPLPLLPALCTIEVAASDEADPPPAAALLAETEESAWASEDAPTPLPSAKLPFVPSTFGKELDRASATPASKNLFFVRSHFSINWNIYPNLYISQVKII